jgi:hypothetical protein
MLGRVILLLLCLEATSVVQAEPHWSLQPRRNPTIPRFAGAAEQQWVRTPVDALILDRLLKAGLKPAPEADRATLIRRLTFDLTGLPPTPEAVASFVADPAPDAYERLVDRLLASPQYGERWARHWLDVVRFAESEGFEYDRHRPGAWRYRDYVIRSFNDDKPYDRFVLEQLAGDELDPANHELLIAAGFHRLGPVRRNAGNQNVAFSRNEVLTELTDAIGASFLGLTVGCARCHDHKFDAISQRDYYRMQAFFAGIQEHDIVLADAKTQAEWNAHSTRVTTRIKKLQDALKELEGEQRQRVELELKELQKEVRPPLPTISTVKNDAERTVIHVLHRGDPERPRDKVGPHVLSALAPSTPELASDARNPRTALANWINEPNHPLTARVLVNRLWQYHFVRGIVSTPNDFGVNGDTPSHPELLDYLANEFISHGRHIKPIHRLILLSSVYRQSSAVRGGFPRRRLDAEQVRDAMLSVSGQLNRKAGGPSVIVPVEADLVHLLYEPSQWTVTPDETEHNRRSIYLIAKRNLALPFNQVFDQPDPSTSCPRRVSSTHALQSLELLNGKLSNRLAAAFAERLIRECGDDHTRQVTRAYQLVASRPPSKAELAVALEFLKDQSLKEFALALFNLNAFLYVS